MAQRYRLRCFISERCQDHREVAGDTASHGRDATRLSLAHKYDHVSWIDRRAKVMDELAAQTVHGIRVASDLDLGKVSIQKERAMCAGLFANVLDRWDLLRLRSKHAIDSAWMIWGCYAGGASGTHGSSYAATNPWKRYFERMNLGAASVDGIAKEIARELRVHCTGATGQGGTDFWHVVERRHTSTIEKTATEFPPRIR
jgi:hypothetical protein